MGVLGDRHSRRLVMASSDLSRVVLVGLGAVAIFLKMSPAIVYALAAGGVVVSTAFRPAQAAIIPALASSPQELTASNVVSSSIESVGIFAGPAVAGLVLVLFGANGPAAVFILAALTFLWSALLILRIDEPPREVDDDVEANERPSFIAQALGGFGAVARDRGPRLLVGLFAAQSLIAGTLLVFEVVIALQLLGRGDGWVGVLSAAFGVGGILGAVISGASVGRARLAVSFGGGLLLWGIPLVLIGIWPYPVVAVGAMALIGVGNTLFDVSCMTLLQRSVSDDILARVFGVMETVFLAAVAIGAVVAPILVRIVHPQTALIVCGAFLPVVIVVWGRKLLAVDAAAHVPEHELALLRGISFFAPLPAPVLEHLARRLVPVREDAGTRIFDQGDSGDLFYIVAQGAVQIDKDGEAVAEVLPGGYFGEIALLHDVPRQAGATAVRDSELLSLEGDDFIAAVTGHANSQEAAEAVVRSYGPGLGIRG